MKIRYFLLSFIVLASPLQAQIFQWRDASGVLHYSDTNANQNATPVTVTVPTPPTQPFNPPSSAPPGSTASAPGNITPQNAVGTAQPEPMKATPQEILQAKDNSTVTNQFCNTAQQNLQTLETAGRRVYDVTPQGEYHFLSEQEKAARIAQTKMQLKDFCTSAPPPKTN